MTAKVKWVNEAQFIKTIRSMMPVKLRAKGRVGTNIEYGPYVELGTSKMRAQPYLRPAFDEKRGEAIREIAAVLRMRIPSAPKAKVALRVGGMVIETAAKIKAPVLSGTLRSSLTTEVVDA